ncbi:DinB family protein [Jiulongibacter sp. NS-SX5]|uniref:DinB family protein n=1 Tax=Jiulongibacter sp. NS-SX5 TaxID=3463854 RepID=UPI0040592121
MKEIADQLRELIALLRQPLLNLTEQEVSDKPNPTKWSKKEIIGHLIDSAVNNQKKFIMAQERNGQDITGYHQDEWVKLQAYHTADWATLVNLFCSINEHLAHVMENVEKSSLSHTLTIDGVGPFTLEFIIKDYNEHLKHHMKKVLPNAGLESTFEMVY